MHLLFIVVVKEDLFDCKKKEFSIIPYYFISVLQFVAIIDTCEVLKTLSLSLQLKL